MPLAEPAIDRIVSILSQRGIQAIVFYPRPPQFNSTSDPTSNVAPSGPPSKN